MITRREQAESSRAALLEAAIDVFSGGYDAATVSEILDRTGMARGALYHYFPGGKEDLFAAAVEELDAAWHEDLARHPGGDPLDRIVAATSAFFAHCQSRAFRQIVLIDAPARFPDRWTATDEYVMLKTEVDELHRRGRLRTDPAATADALFGSIERSGLAVGVCAEPAVAAARALAVIRAFLDAVCTTP